MPILGIEIIFVVSSMCTLFAARFSTAARTLPSSPSFYTRAPMFFDTVALLNATYTRACLALGKPLESKPDTPFLPTESRWKNAEEMVQLFGCPLSDDDHRVLIEKLGLLDTFPHTPSLSSLLAGFRHTEHQQPDGEPARSTDIQGIVSAKASKKCARALVWLFPSSSESNEFCAARPILINGFPMHTFFPRIERIFTVVKALRLTGRICDYYVSASVHGGGEASAAQAVGMAIARALVTREPHLAETLSELTAPDCRQVERKKPGRPKARKRFTWVKR